MAIALYHYLQPVSKLPAGHLDPVPIPNYLACFNASLELLLARQPDVVKPALQVPKQAKLIGGQAGALGRPNVPEKAFFGAPQLGMLCLDLMFVGLHHQLPDPIALNLPQ